MTKRIGVDLSLKLVKAIPSLIGHREVAEDVINNNDSTKIVITDIRIDKIIKEEAIKDAAAVVVVVAIGLVIEVDIVDKSLTRVRDDNIRVSLCHF